MTKTAEHSSFVHSCFLRHSEFDIRHAGGRWGPVPIGGFPVTYSGWYARDLPRVRRVICTLAASAPPCSIGCLPESMAASLCCGSTTPTRAERRRSVGPDPARLPLAGHRLGRRARSRRAARSVLPVAASGPLSGGGRKAAGRRPCVSRLRHAGGMQAEREAAQAEKRPFLYSRRWMAETPADQARSRRRAGRPWCG